jgi:hypothetical protein
MNHIAALHIAKIAQQERLNAAAAHRTRANPAPSARRARSWTFGELARGFLASLRLRQRPQPTR